MKAISFISQNVRGIKSVNRLEELSYVISQRKNLLGDLIKKFLNMNLAEWLPQDLKKNEVNRNRKSQGVGIILNKDCVVA